MENADAERDVYDELLTQAEIQGNVNRVNGESRDHRRTFLPRTPWSLDWVLTSTLRLLLVINALKAAEQAILSGDEEKLYEALKAMGVQNLQAQNKGWYLKQLQAARENKEQVGRKSRLANITLHCFINLIIPNISSVRFLFPSQSPGTRP